MSEAGRTRDVGVPAGVLRQGVRGSLDLGILSLDGEPPENLERAREPGHRRGPESQADPVGRRGGIDGEGACERDRHPVACRRRGVAVGVPGTGKRQPEVIGARVALDIEAGQGLAGEGLSGALPNPCAWSARSARPDRR